MEIKEVYKHIMGFLLLLISTAGPLHAAGSVKAFQEGVKNYQQGNYTSAIAEFSKVADRNIKNVPLFYNLGNSYLKNGDLGHAVLWYKRALRLNPHDPDLIFNYNYALTCLADMAPGQQDSVFLRVILFWNFLLSSAVIQWTAIFLNGIFWIIITWQEISGSKALDFLRHTVLILAVVAALAAWYNYYEDYYHKEAVILPGEIAVRSGLSDNSTVLFVLHSGSLIQVDGERGNFLKIRFSNDKIGWIRKDAAELI